MSYRNAGGCPDMLVKSEKRNDLGTYINLPLGLQVMLYNGTWLVPSNRLADAQLPSLQSESDSLATIMSVAQLRNSTEADRVSMLVLFMSTFTEC